jgi:hypothetical protein
MRRYSLVFVQVEGRTMDEEMFTQSLQVEWRTMDEGGVHLFLSKLGKG